MEGITRLRNNLDLCCLNDLDGIKYTFVMYVYRV